MRVPSYTTTAVPPPIISNSLDYIRLTGNEYIDTGISVAGDLQEQISLLNQRIEALEELLLEFGIKKVFDKADNQE